MYNAAALRYDKARLSTASVARTLQELDVNGEQAMKSLTARSGSSVFRSFLLVLALLVTPAATAAVYLSVGLAPPALPVYAQPVAPGPGYIWTPGYWAYGPAGYYWVPGTWVIAPYVGALWTPGYWGWGGSAFIWHGGYWGPHVGFYGGINYGFGYFGVGFNGGRWEGHTFNYNTAVSHVNVTNIHNTYSESFNANSGLTRTSFNGGAGGLTAQPTAEERTAANEVHQPATQLQMRHQQMASNNHAMLASVNHGTPSIMATSRPGAFGHARTSAFAGGSSQHVTTRQGTYHAPSHTSNAPQAQHFEQRNAQSAPHGQPQHGGGGAQHHEESHGR